MTTRIQIAHRSTRGDGIVKAFKPRWTELAVYFDPAPGMGGQRWIAETRGHSSVPGETTRTVTYAAADLARALDHFADRDGSVSTPARTVSVLAQTWALQNRDVWTAAAAGDARSYTDAQREEAAARMSEEIENGALDLEVIDAVAAALGMQRAARG